MKILLIIFFCLLKLNAQNFEYESKDIIIHHKDTSKKTIVIWGGISYATPKWMEKQIPKKNFRPIQCFDFVVQKRFKINQRMVFPKIPN